MIRLGILGSTRGTNLLPLIEAIANQQLSAKIAVVISNKKAAPILERALSYQLPAKFINPEGLTREVFDQQISETLRDYQVDLIVLIGYMRILSAEFIANWKNKIINIHPSLLPAFSGKMDMQVHQAVLDSGAKQTGCTVHFVTEEVDAGPIILQKTCSVLADDSPDDIKKRVQALEGLALIESINIFTQHLPNRSPPLKKGD